MIVVLVVIAIAGLRPAEPPPENRARWDETGALRLEPFAQLLSADRIELQPGPFALEAWITPGLPVAPGTNQEILSLVDGPGVAALLVGQWPGGFLLRVRDDNPDGDPKRDRYVDHTIVSERIHLAISVEPERIRFIVNGHATDFRWRADRGLGDGGFRGHVLVGHRGAGWPAWRGAVHALVLREGPLPEAVAPTDRTPDEPLGGFASRARDASVRAAWRLEGRSAGPVGCPIAECPKLIVPERVIDPAPPLFGAYVHPNRPDRWLPADLLLNVLGFLPLGYLIALLLGRSNAPGVIGSAAVLGLALSGAIELAQWWMPGRNSSLFDLLCNGTGSALGAWIALEVAARRRRIRSH